MGKVLHGSDKSVVCIIVFEIKENIDGSGVKYHYLTELTRRETEFMQNTSTQFYFSNKNIDKLIFFSD